MEAWIYWESPWIRILFIKFPLQMIKITNGRVWYKFHASYILIDIAVDASEFIRGSIGNLPINWCSVNIPLTYINGESHLQVITTHHMCYQFVWVPPISFPLPTVCMASPLFSGGVWCISSNNLHVVFSTLHFGFHHCYFFVASVHVSC